MEMRMKLWCILFWAVLIAGASHFNTRILTKAATTCGSSRQQINKKKNDDEYLRNFSNRGAWAAIVHIEKDGRKPSLSSIFISHKTKERLIYYQNYLKDLTVRCHLKIVNYSNSFLENSELCNKGVERGKEMYGKSKLKMQAVLEHWEETWTEWEETWTEWWNAAPRKGHERSGVPGMSGDLSSLYAEVDRMVKQGGWKPVIQKKGITVWKMYLPSHREGHEYPLVKATGIINAPPEKVLEMMIDSNRVKEYNKFSKGRDDLEVLNANTKIVWNRTWPPLCTKPHDFCSILHTRREEGKLVMITKATDHPSAPVRPGYQRSKILLGISIMKPVKGDAEKTELTTYNHVVSKGIPILIADKVSVKTAADFINNVNKAFPM